MSFRFRLTFAIVLAMLFVVVSGNMVIQRFLLDAHLEELRDELKAVAQTAAISVDVPSLKEIPLTKEGKESPAYKRVSDFLVRVRDCNPSVHYIYVLTKTSSNPLWQFIVDIDPSNRKGRPSANPGDKYNATRFPEMLKAWDSPSADKKLETDEWGATLSGYAPIRDANGSTVAVIGVDLSADDFALTSRTANDRCLLLLIVGVLLSLVIGVVLSVQISAPIGALIEGTDRISKGDLSYQVPVRGNDEFSRLAVSFNRMAKDLDKAQEQNQNYFYGVIQTLVRIVEAKDTYTRGHSERVAEYAAGIAVKMGFSQADVAFLRQAALLHDIGKIGIHDGLLNKNGALTPEERDLINQHPVIGEEIIKPVALSPEMAAVIRSHHERFDGKGYPDHLQGARINILSQIICVADTYDAMTSTRAYRKARSREEALIEIRKNRGTQFDPKIVDAFLSLVTDEVRSVNSSLTS